MVVLIGPYLTLSMEAVETNAPLWLFELSLFELSLPITRGLAREESLLSFMHLLGIRLALWTVFIETFCFVVSQ